jgi:hypothetical protein
MSQAALPFDVVALAGVTEGITPGVKAAWVRASANYGGQTAVARAVVGYPPPNADVMASVEHWRPRQSWYDEDHEGLY